MTKLTVNTEFEKGLSSKREIEALKAGKIKPKQRELPKFVTDAFNLLVAGCVGGACAWLAIKFFL